MDSKETTDTTVEEGGDVPSRFCLMNTMSGRKEIFMPLRENKVKMFTCGPSIYDRPHIGNHRTFLFEDILQRYLEYRGYPVERLINFTDVEDKAIANARKKGVAIETLTQPVAERFLRECAALRIRMPTTIPRSSTSVDQAVHLIQRLLKKGHAYWHGKDVFYDPLKFKGFGKLYGLDMSRWPKRKIRFHKDTYPGKRWNLGDFILWKGRGDSGEKDTYWKTEIGEGRPSWNIQDPAMITKHLGYKVDISCGGIDNLYRHHDYNIAVIEGVSDEPFARYWLHGEHVLANGRKMSKSRGNIVYLDDLTDRGYAPHHIRFYLTYGHYREKLNMNEDRLHLARGKVDTFRQIVRQISTGGPGSETSERSVNALIGGLTGDFEKYMDDDMNVKAAFDAVYEGASKLAVLESRGKLAPEDRRGAADAFGRIDTVLGVL